MQSQHTEALIRKEFKRFHQFLWEEEEDRIAALKKEEEQRNQTVKKKIDKLSIQIASVMDTIKATEKQMQREDLAFLLVKQHLFQLQFVFGLFDVLAKLTLNLYLLICRTTKLHLRGE